MPAPHKHFDCPYCCEPVPVLHAELEAASAVVPCLNCGHDVYVTMGKLAQFQPGIGEISPPTYDSGA